MEWPDDGLAGGRREECDPSTHCTSLIYHPDPVHPFSLLRRLPSSGAYVSTLFFQCSLS